MFTFLKELFRTRPKETEIFFIQNEEGYIILNFTFGLMVSICDSLDRINSYRDKNSDKFPDCQDKDQVVLKVRKNFPCNLPSNTFLEESELSILVVLIPIEPCNLDELAKDILEKAIINPKITKFYKKEAQRFLSYIGKYEYFGPLEK